MRGKKPFTLAWKILLVAAILTAAYALGLKETWVGEWIQKIMVYGFMLILAGSLIAYLNWSEAKKRV
jgi:undecaprenyl pyrophosphate phosphatase UppP